VNPAIHKRRKQVGRLLRYLFGPGRQEEHVNPHLVAAWHGHGGLAALEPPTLANGTRDVLGLSSLLKQPLHAARNAPALTVWHCSIRNAPEDPVLSDPQWAQIAEEVMDAVKLAPHGDGNAVRWVAVRHNDDHIHVVATLVRQDGRTAWGWNDWVNARNRCYELERRFGLRQVGPMDGTSHRRPRAPELNKARRLGRASTSRDELRRLVRQCVASSAGEDEFFARLADLGVLVKRRASTRNTGQWTGYAVALQTNTTSAGEPVWFSGGSLANDLTLPKLRQRWADPDVAAASTKDSPRISAAARAQALSTASQAIRAAAAAMGELAATNPEAAQALALAAADSLVAVATTVEGHRGGPVTRAVELFDKAARQPSGRVAKHTSQSGRLRTVSRLVSLMGHVSGDDDIAAVLTVLVDLALLAEHLATLRDAQMRHHQADAARTVAVSLRTAVAAGGRFGQPTQNPLDLSVVPAGQDRDEAVPDVSTKDSHNHPGRSTTR
jgi:hypothetical protein